MDIGEYSVSVTMTCFGKVSNIDSQDDDKYLITGETRCKYSERDLWFEPGKTCVIITSVYFITMWGIF